MGCVIFIDFQVPWGRNAAQLFAEELYTALPPTAIQIILDGKLQLQPGSRFPVSKRRKFRNNSKRRRSSSSDCNSGGGSKL